MLSAILCSVHNVRFYERLVADARAAVVADRYEEWRREFLRRYAGGGATDPD